MWPRVRKRVQGGGLGWVGLACWLTLTVVVMATHRSPLWAPADKPTYGGRRPPLQLLLLMLRRLGRVVCILAPSAAVLIGSGLAVYAALVAMVSFVM